MARAWLLLIYSVPTKPSRTRWHVWRELRRVGAILLRDGVAILPDTPTVRTWMRDVAKGIAAGGGSAQVARARFGVTEDRDILRNFERDRSREYDEIVESCRSLLAHVDREAEHAQFSFAELTELEADLDKLRRWNTEAGDRDRFRSPRAARAERIIAQCERKIARFAERTSRSERAAAAPRAARATGAGRAR